MPHRDLLSELRHTLGRLEAGLGAVQEALVFTDIEGRIQWTNASFDRLVGEPRLRTLGQPLPEVLPARYVEGRREPTECLLGWARIGPGHTSWDFSPKPPRKVMDVSWARVSVPDKPSLIFSFRDQTEFIKVQDALIKARDELEVRVKERTAELRNARDEAVNANRAKTAFLANMSHEIRTPMNAVIGMTELLIDTPLSAHQKELVSTIRDSGEHLLRLINSILDISRIEANSMEVVAKPFCLQTLLRDVYQMIRPDIEKKNLEFSLDIHPDVPLALMGDGQKVRQILLNLLSNACKYTDQGSIAVTASLIGNSSLDSEAITVRISVVDTGIGISTKFQSVIFDDFTRHISAGTVTPGTGLGLAITARLCQLLGGEITVDSKEAEGSRFTVDLPFTRAAAASLEETPPTAEIEPWRSSPPSILVAEDNDVNQRLMLMMLKKLGCSPEFVADGLSAVERVNAGDIDLVFMDVEMPGIDGLEATRLIRRSHALKPYIIALTAYSFDTQRKCCLKAGMNDFLSKPLRRAELTAALWRFHRLWVAGRQPS